LNSLSQPSGKETPCVLPVAGSFRQNLPAIKEVHNHLFWQPDTHTAKLPEALSCRKHPAICAPHTTRAGITGSRLALKPHEFSEGTKRLGQSPSYPDRKSSKSCGKPQSRSSTSTRIAHGLRHVASRETGADGEVSPNSDPPRDRGKDEAPVLALEMFYASLSSPLHRRSTTMHSPS